MWLALYPWLLAAFLWALCFVIPWHFVALSVALYVLHHALYVYRVSEPRPWPWLRRLALWDLFHRRHMGGRHSWAEGSNWADYETTGVGRVFLLPSATPHAELASILTFGLHGTHPPVIAHMEPLLVLPAHLFALPIICNVCQWVGGIPTSSPNDRLAMTDALTMRHASLVMTMSSDDEGAESSVITWLGTLGSPVAITPTVYINAQHLYLTVGPFHVGLFLGPLPRSCPLRIGLGSIVSTHTERVADGDDAVTAVEPDVLRARIDRVHGLLLQSMQ